MHHKVSSIEYCNFIDSVTIVEALQVLYYIYVKQTGPLGYVLGSVYARLSCL